MENQGAMPNASAKGGQAREGQMGTGESLLCCSSGCTGGSSCPGAWGLEGRGSAGWGRRPGVLVGKKHFHRRVIGRCLNTTPAQIVLSACFIPCQCLWCLELSLPGAVSLPLISSLSVLTAPIPPAVCSALPCRPLWQQDPAQRLLCMYRSKEQVRKNTDEVTELSVGK